MYGTDPFSEKQGRSVVSLLLRPSAAFNSFSVDRIHSDHGTISHMVSHAKQRGDFVCLLDGNAEFGMNKIGHNLIFIGRFKV